MEYLSYELRGDVAVLGLNRPSKRNAISDAFIEELAEAIRRAEREAKAGVIHGHGPHFCAGAAASRCLIAEVALPMLFERLKGLRLTGEVRFTGWAFRGPVSVPVAWDA